jgi:hypothetical protein
MRLQTLIDNLPESKSSNAKFAPISNNTGKIIGHYQSPESGFRSKTQS